MSYTRPFFNAANASWLGALNYTRLPHNNADASFEPAEGNAVAQPLATANAITPTPTASVHTSFDINLPKTDTSEPWRDYHTTAASLIATVGTYCSIDAERPAFSVKACHTDSDAASSGSRICLYETETAHNAGHACYTDAALTSTANAIYYLNAPRGQNHTKSCHAIGRSIRNASPSCFINLDRDQNLTRDCYHGAPLETTLRANCFFEQGLADRVLLRGCWKQAVLPYNWIRLRLPAPVIYPPQPLVRLCISGTQGSTALSLGRTPCAPLNQRYYLMHNTAALTLFDGTPLPTVSMTISTDADSWCWALSASLYGIDVDALISPEAPAYLPRQVRATINDWTWEFIVDEPRLSRRFGRAEVSISGRSRSAWLAAPFAATASGSNAASLTINQAADAALDLTGWTIDWTQMPDWTIPARVLTWSGTPIERLRALVAVIDGCLATHRINDQIIARPRYPARPSKWVDIAPDHSLSNSAIITSQRSDDTQPLYNGVLVSGTTHGCVADCFITGTDGALQAPSISDALLCDASGVAARARALAILSHSGPGWSVALDTVLYAPDAVDEPRLIEPGSLVLLDGVMSIARSVSITAQWQGGALGVRQSVTVEQRAQEA
jgi:hypothetical protein